MVLFIRNVFMKKRFHEISFIVELWSENEKVKLSKRALNYVNFSRTTGMSKTDDRFRPLLNEV